MHGEEKSNRKREDEKSEWVRITPTINPFNYVCFNLLQNTQFSLEKTK